MRRSRRGFTLLEVIVALAILVVALTILIETQTAAVDLTKQAQDLVTATQLAQEKMAEVQLYVEREGFTDQDVEEQGDFSDFGDEALDLEFGDDLKKYHYEWSLMQIDLGLAGDIAQMAQEFAGSQPGAENRPDTPDAGDAVQGGLGALGISNEMITETLANYIREARVRVWWGESSEKAEERGDEVILTMHVSNPGAAIPGLSGTNSTNARAPRNPGGVPTGLNPPRGVNLGGSGSRRGGSNQ